MHGPRTREARALQWAALGLVISAPTAVLVSQYWPIVGGWVETYLSLPWERARLRLILPHLLVFSGAGAVIGFLLGWMINDRLLMRTAVTVSAWLLLVLVPAIVLGAGILDQEFARREREEASKAIGALAQQAREDMLMSRMPRNFAEALERANIMRRNRGAPPLPPTASMEAVAQEINQWYEADVKSMTGR